MARLAERTGRRYHIVDYSGHPEAERVLVVMGSGGETVAGDRGLRSTRAASGSAWSQVRLYRPFPAQALVEALPATVRQRRRARPDEGARLDRRAALPRHGRGADRVVRRRRAGGDAAGRRRPLRPVLEGVHAGHGRRRVRRARARAAAAPVHDRHQRRRLRHEPRLRRVARHRAARDGARDLLRPRLGRDGRREQEHDQDPRRRGGPARAGLLRLRLEEVRLADGLAPALRAAADPGAVPRAAGELRRLPPVRAARPGRRARPRGGRRDAAAQLPAPAGRGLGCAVAPGAGADPRQAHRRCTRSTPAGSPARSASPDGPTSSCRPASSPSPACCRASRRSSGSRRRSRRPTAGAAPRWSSATRPRSTARSTACTGSRCPSR